MSDKRREPSCTNNHDAMRRHLRETGGEQHTCPVCGWELKPMRDRAERGHRSRMEFQHEDGTWLFTDTWGDVYRLRPTYEPGMPLIIEPVSKWTPGDDE